ncbi:MAG: hypothetical protein ACJAVI_002624 [Candidatus Azotimanducaceae bacterium]
MSFGHCNYASVAKAPAEELVAIVLDHDDTKTIILDSGLAQAAGFLIGESRE